MMSRIFLQMFARLGVAPQFALAAALTAIALAGTLFFLLKSRRNYLLLPQLLPAEGIKPGYVPDVTVIIPARNEEHNIGRCVRSLEHPEVLVVDDHSSDDTAKVAEEAGAAVMKAPPLRPGLLGKPSACAAGAAIVDTRWLLFVDADTSFEPGFLPAIVQHAERNGLDLVSCFLWQDTPTLIEKIIMPYAFALYFCGVDGIAVSSAQSVECLANGQCLMMRREAYEFIGGHMTVATSVIEDVALARVAKRHRMKAAILRAENFGRVRMYESFGAIWRGFEKNSFRFLMVNPQTGAQVVAASIFLTAWLPLVWYLTKSNLFFAASVVAVTPSILLAPWYSTFIGMLCAPLGIYLFQLIALNAMVSTSLGKKVLWKARKV